MPSGIRSIGDSAFQNNPQLTTITGLNAASLEEIGAHAFNGCSELQSITLGSSIQTLGESFLNGTKVSNLDLNNASSLSDFTNAFKDNTAITMVTLPTHLLEISEGAFDGATKLSNVNLTNLTNLQTIKGSAFKNTQLPSLNITNHTNLTTIEGHAFSGISTLASLTLPDSIQTIGDGAFEGAGLTAINLSQATNLTRIGSDAFKDSQKVNSTFSLPTNLVTIGDNAFMNLGIDQANSNSNAITFTLPNSLQTIGESAFANAKVNPTFSGLISLETIGAEAFKGTRVTNVDLSSASRLTEIGDGAFNNEGKNYNDYAGTIKLPTSLITIGDKAFKSSKASEVDMMNLNSLTTIGANAFEGNTNLKTLKLPIDGALTNIENGAFYKTSALTSVTLPNTITEINSWVFAESGLTSISLDSTKITSIGDFAFLKSKLASLDLSSNSKITDIKQFAFWENTDLTSVKLPNSLTNLGSYAFAKSNNASFTSLDLKDTQLTHLNTGTFNETSIATITLPKTLTTMAENVFSVINNSRNANSAIKTVTWEPTTATSLPEHFYSDGNFKNITNLTLKGSINTLPSNVPSGTVPSDLESVNLKDSQITIIPDNAFNNVVGLSSITLPDNLTSIGAHAFDNTKLSSIDLSKQTNLSSIGPGAFMNTTYLKSANFSATKITAISDSLFENATQLTSVKFPTTITSIGAKAFKGATKLENLNNGTAANPPSGVSALDLSMYSSLQSIGAYAFENTEFDKIDNNKLPSSLTSLGAGAFKGMKQLNSADLSNLTSLKEIPESLFENANLAQKTVQLPTSITKIGKNAFNNTQTSQINLDSLTNLTTLEDYALAGMENLNRINLSKATKLKHLPAYFIQGSVKSSPGGGSGGGSGGSGGSGNGTSPFLSRSFTSRQQAAAPNNDKLTLPNSITSIDPNAFNGSLIDKIDLSQLTLDSTTLNLNFGTNTTLTTLKFPKNTTTFNTDMVNGASNLNELVLPGSAINWTVTSPAAVEPNAATKLQTIQFDVMASSARASGFDSINWEQVAKIVSMFTGNGQLSYGSKWNKTEYSSDLVKSGWTDTTNSSSTNLSDSISNATKSFNDVIWTYQKPANGSSGGQPYATIKATSSVSYFKATNGNGYSFGKDTTNNSSSKSISITINLYTN